MTDFTVLLPAHLPGLLQAFRKQAGFTQAEVALRMGLTQQALSALERDADRIGATRLLRYLSVVGVDLVLRERAKNVIGPECNRFEW
jgi:HTH-type transcriptional regulator/antitoxin HipB